MLNLVSQAQKRQIPYDITYMWNLKMLNSEMEGGIVLTRGWGAVVDGERSDIGQSVQSYS
jgi:hypothetical protein